MDNINLQMKMDEFLPLRDVVFNTLRQGILTGELKPGERLMETHLAEKLGVSRTPIREAIRMLELEGLATMVPRRGAEVAKISVEDLRDVLEVRKVLESLATRLACSRITESQKETLKKLAADFIEKTKGGDSTEIALADVRFHDEILNASGNKRLIQMVNNLADRIYRYRLEYIKDEKNHKRLIEEHDMILKNIIDGDTSQAVKYTEIHIDNQEENVLNQLYSY